MVSLLAPWQLTESQRSYGMEAKFGVPATQQDLEAPALVP